jgi:hypothetical protein
MSLRSMLYVEEATILNYVLKCQTSFIWYIMKQPIYHFRSLIYGLENMLHKLYNIQMSDKLH